MTETSLKIDELILRPSVKSQFSNILFCFGLVFLSLRGLEYEGGVIYYAGKLSGGFAIFFALVVLVNIYNYRYLIAEDFVQATEGKLALNMFTHKVKYRDIKLLETRKGILGRILNYG
ncbi:MAG: hypothetical protein NZO16_03755, partial [Deltaproteobacteria bacterium]|nr:hypothetical protein [Deltaproteobacteria bacterium]